MPLIIGSGPGAENRMVIGVVIFSGVAVSAFLTIFVIPALYILMAKNTGSPLSITHELEALEKLHKNNKTHEAQV